MALMGSHIQVGIDRKTRGSIVRSLIATATMAAAVFALQNYFQTTSLAGFQSLLFPYSVILITAITVFAATCVFVKHPELTEIAGIARRRRK